MHHIFDCAQKEKFKKKNQKKKKRQKESKSF